MEEHTPGTYLGLQLDRFQQDAIRALDTGANVLVAAPTGAGKTLIADYLVDRVLEAGRSVIYTAPIKALSNQKFRDFSLRHPGHVGIVTGDVSIHPRAPIVIMTTEVLRNAIFLTPARLEHASHVILDEIHYLDDPERGTVWEETLLFAPQHIRFLCLSATVPNLDPFAAWMTTVRDAGVETVVEERRPVPLRHSFYVEGVGVCGPEVLQRIRRPRGRRTRSPLPEARGDKLLQHVIDARQLPCLYFAFGRRRCEERAAATVGWELLDPADRGRALSLFDALCAHYGLSHTREAVDMRRLVTRGVAFHHAGMLPALKEVVEQLFTARLLKLVFTTETFALGINMPARAVLFDEMRKYGGVSFRPLKTREYYQMAGRAGRRGIDAEGFVYSRVDPSWIDPRLAARIVSGRVEDIESQFNLCYSTILNIYSHAGTRIHAAQEKSFYCFQRPKHLRKKLRAQLGLRLRLLADLRYIVRDRLTEKGRFAARMYGYELAAAELYFHGHLDRYDDDVLCAVAAAIPFEARKGTRYDLPKKGPLAKASKALRALVAVVRDHEEALGIRGPTALPDFSIALSAYRWARGAEFAELSESTTDDPGDLIRALRMAVQILRQMRFAVGKNRAWRDRLRACEHKMNRGIVNAEDELRASVDAETLCD